MVSIKRKGRTISYGHCLRKHHGFCHHLHGHNGEWEVEFVGSMKKSGSEEGMIKDFGFLKSVLETIHSRFDHRFLIEKNDPRCDHLEFIEQTLVILDFPPTAENICQEIYEMIEDELGSLGISALDCRVKSVVFYETPNCSAKYEK